MTHRLINTVDNQIVNVGNPVETTIEFVAKTILNILEIDPERLEIRPRSCWFSSKKVARY